MYRYSVDKAITYTSEDIVLFKESPFACWMERLTLENPDHGIPPNVGSTAPRDTMEPQDDLADTLRAEGKDVVLVDWEEAEPVRRNATLEAMRHGADFIVNGHLALGPISGSANLLMRTSGYSDLGEYLYVPCNTQPKTNLHAALRLCFLADLLHSLQGQLPPQMLIIRGGSDVVPLQTEDHIYHYRAVKQRFMAVQRDFRKHKMPDPAESSHFGRWADCANEVLKQRALTGSAGDAADDEVKHQPALLDRVAGDEPGSTAYDLDAVNQQQPAAATTETVKPSGTLVEQARMMTPTAFAPTPAVAQEADTLQNLSFIGSSSHAPTIGQGVPRAAPTEPEALDQTDESLKRAPAPSLRNPERHNEPAGIASGRRSDAIPPNTPAKDFGFEAQPSSAPVSEKSHPLDSPGFQRDAPSMVDFDTGESVQDDTDIPAPALVDLPTSIRQPSQPAESEDKVESKTKNHRQGFADYDKFLGRLYVDPCNSSLITNEQLPENDSED